MNSQNNPNSNTVIQNCEEKFTKQEYLRALAEFHKKGEQNLPSKLDHNDILYKKKFAQNLPPLESYFLLPPLYRNSSNQDNI
jgi:hypothetical protein